MAGSVRSTGVATSRRKRRRMAGGAAFSDINVTPLVDVMLVLLVIFMITAPMLTAGVQVDLPDAQAKALPGQDEPLSISIAKDGKIYLQETALSMDALREKLAAIAENKKDLRVFVRGDETVDYGRIMEVVSQVHAAGLHKIALVTSGESGKSSRRRR